MYRCAVQYVDVLAMLYRLRHWYPIYSYDVPYIDYSGVVYRIMCRKRLEVPYVTVFYRCAVYNVRTQLCCTACDNRIAYVDSVQNMTRIWLFCSLKRFFQTTLNYVCSTVYGPAILYMVMLYCMELYFDVVYDKYTLS